MPSVDGHVPGDDHEPGATPPARPAALLGNQAAARMLSTEGARPEAVIGLTAASNRAVARMLDPAAGGGSLTPDVADRIAAQRGGGAPLPDTLRSPMEQHLGTDLGGTRVHTDDTADTLARSLGAEAFTTGNDIFFSAGSYAPQSAAGRELIAHEAVHVAQQSGRIGFSGRVSDPSDAAEVEARAIAPAVARSAEASATAVPATGVAGRDVHLAPDTEAGPTPAIAGYDLRRRDSNGRVTVLEDRLQVGDQVAVNVNFTGDPQALGPESAWITGLTGLNPTGFRWVRPGTYQITFDATSIGTAHGAVHLHVPTLEPVQLDLRVDVEMDAQKFINLASGANTVVDNAYKAAKLWMLGLCIAYGTAYKRHTDALEDQAESDQLAADLILGAALAFVPGGLGGLAGAAMKRKQAGDFLIDGVKDLTKYGLRSGAQVGVNQAFPSGGGGLSAFPTDPREWRNEVETSVEAESLQVGLHLQAWQRMAIAEDPTFALNFDPMAAVNSALSISGQTPGSLPKVDQTRTADDFERGMWMQWLVSFGYRIVTVRHNYVTLPYVSIGRDKDMVLDNARKKVVDRCEALGLDIAPFMETARKNAQAVADARNRKRDAE
jgi:hypothetical protein